MSNQCATCKWWVNDAEDYDVPRQPGEDRYPDYDSPLYKARLEAAKQWGHCNLIVDGDRIRQGKPHSVRAYPVDASDYHASLMVRADFGCVEHTAAD